MMNVFLVFSCIDTDIVTALAWSPDSQLLSCSDDKIIHKWGADGEKLGNINSINVYVSGMSWFPTTGKQVRDYLDYC